LTFRWIDAKNGKAVAVGNSNYDLYVWDDSFGTWEIPKWIEGKIDFYSCDYNWEDELYCRQTNGYLWKVDLENETRDPFPVHSSGYISSWEVKDGLWNTNSGNYYCYNFEFATQTWRQH